MYEKVLKPSFIAVCLLLLAALPGCQAPPPHNPEVLLAASAAATSGRGLWQLPVKGVDATLRPDSTAYGGHNFILNAAYRVVGPDEVRFAVFLPQGNKLGQCSRKGRDVNCSNLSFPGASGLVRSSFAALDEILALAPAEGDTFELVWPERADRTDRTGHSGQSEQPDQSGQPGPASSNGHADRNGPDWQSGGTSGAQPVLRRARSGIDGISYVITDLEGEIISASKRGRFSSREDDPTRISSWKISFGGNAASYRFTPQGNNWMVDVAIVRFIE